jgi:hypothetical protein
VTRPYEYSDTGVCEINTHFDAAAFLHVHTPLPVFQSCLPWLTVTCMPLCVHLCRGPQFSYRVLTMVVPLFTLLTHLRICMCGVCAGLCSHVFVRFDLCFFGYVCAASWHNHREQLIVRRTIVSALYINLSARSLPCSEFRALCRFGSARN